MSSLISELPWPARAVCGSDPEAMFVKGAAVVHAKRICAGCPVREECLAHALENREDRGIWGGLTRLERRKLLARSDVLTAS